MIRRSGENIAALEVETVLGAHAGVAEVAVIAVPDDLRDEEVMAFVIPAFHGEPQKAAMKSATEILRGVGYGSGKEPWLPVGIGINFGEAYVGKLALAM